jgi:ADP-heptose:LPS heptosyltransferase
MCTPVLAEARRLWPMATITVLGRKHNLALLAGCRIVDAFLEAKAVPFTLTRHKDIRELLQQVTAEQFDLAIILLGDEFAQLLSEARIPIRVGVRGHVLEPFLTHPYECGEPRTWGPPERLNSLRVLGCQVQESPPQLWVSDHGRAGADRKLRDLGIARGSKYVVVHPFGSTPRQWWDLGNVGELADRLDRIGGWKSVVIGGPETRGRLPVNRNGHVFDLTGQLDIEEMLGVIASSDLVISTDSGPFHIAGALGRPLVGLFRTTRPEHAARYSQASVVFGKDSMCSGSCRWDYCRHQPCRQVGSIGPDQVMTALGNGHSTSVPSTPLDASRSDLNQPGIA